MVRVANDGRLPFQANVPNAETRGAIRELDSDQGTPFISVDRLLDDLNADD